MSPIGEGWAALGAILVFAALPTEIWRWLGVAIGRRFDEDSELLAWVRAVATAIIAAFVAKMILLPTGGLAATPLWLRLAALAVGVAIYFARRRSVFLGALAGCLVLAAGKMGL